MTSAPRCAELARSEAVEPAGTAGSTTGHLLLEWPLPWPRDVGEITELAPLVEALAGTGIRLQAVVAADGPGKRSRVILYRHQRDMDGWVRPSVGIERAVHSSMLVEEAIALVATNAGTITDVADVLVCGHGRRDVCCGSKGAQLVNRLVIDGGLGAGVRLWRTSHLGGHRFAPTALVLPEASSWAFMDERALAGIVARSADASRAAAAYRGCTALPTPAAQAVEAAVLSEVGWSLLDCARRSQSVDPERIRYELRCPDGARMVWTAVVGTGRRIPVPPCGLSLSDAIEHTVEIVIKDLQRSA